MKKILLLCVTSQNVITFRAGLIKTLQENGCAVSVVAFDDEYKEEIKALNVDFYCIKEKNRGMNPLKILSLKGKYKKLIQTIQPDTVFTFMLKPNTFGVKAAKSAGIKNIYSMVEGAGDVFIHNSLKWKAVRFVVCRLYKSSFKNVKKVFFLNNDDKTDFLARKLVKEEQCEVVHGIGVDLEKFPCKPIKNQRSFLMIARMLETKGVYEYCKCARIVKQKYPDAVFNYLGAEGTVKLADIQEYIDDGSVNYLGTTKDVRPYLEECSAFVLPSYREGMPMSIMEAEATGRAIITSDNVGCRDTVENEYNGFLVEKQDYSALAERCLEIIANEEKIIEMGKNSRTFAEKYFDSRAINEQIYKVVNG
ncbi:MAG: glycosyltransferase family 4 protein [Clostridia bacterium]|nr:glycosyltransferase family 4 protein [Clostridia bacterium]